MDLIAHRGNNDHNYPENSKKALLNALNIYYIKGIEFDVRVTKDKKIVINHNKNILTDDPLISDLTLLELKKANPDISTLDEFLKDVKNSKILIIEIKEERENLEICSLLDNILSQYPQLNYYICSFNYELITYFKKNYNYKTGLLIGKQANISRDYKIFDFLSIYYKNLNKFKKADKLICTWTVDLMSDLKNIPDNVLIITNQAYLLK